MKIQRLLFLLLITILLACEDESQVEETETEVDLEVSIAENLPEKTVYGAAHKVRLGLNKHQDSVSVKWTADGGSFSSESGISNTWNAPDEKGVYSLAAEVSEDGSIHDTFDFSEVEVVGSFYETFDSELSANWLVNEETTTTAITDGRLKVTRSTLDDKPANLILKMTHMGVETAVPVAFSVDVKENFTNAASRADYRFVNYFDASDVRDGEKYLFTLALYVVPSQNKLISRIGVAQKGSESLAGGVKFYSLNEYSVVGTEINLDVENNWSIEIDKDFNLNYLANGKSFYSAKRAATDSILILNEVTRFQYLDNSLSTELDNLIIDLK
ncbi:hypothetical protein [Reichenbachiella versicolor]|uniref:hypothetical protein n=1 Tax=Reichenbachiella versicolor TaxID=1821036 RepID=UPI000D6E144D|nr:hypothetical protein [Reichenbachiella versicolor]